MKNKYLFLLLLLPALALTWGCQKEIDPDINGGLIPGGSGSLLGTSSLPDAQVSDFEIVAYLPYWAQTHFVEYDMQYRNITTLILLGCISKAGVQDSTKNGLIWGDSDTGPDPYYQPDLAFMLSYMRFINPNMKIFLGLTDLHNNNTSRAESATLFNDTYRDSTISWLMNRYIDSLDFDGIDIDFEDTSLDSGYIFSNYPKFVKGLSLALKDTAARGRKKLCTVSLGNDWGRDSIVTDTLRKYADWLGFQTYSSEKMDTIIANPYRDVKASLAGWTGAGQMSANKLLLGLAGWAIYVNGSGEHIDDTRYGYYDLLKLPPQDTAFLPYLTTSLNTYDYPSASALRYNGMYETRRKLEWAEESGLKGVFIWDISKDARGDIAQYSLIRTLKDAHDNPSSYDKIVGYTGQDFYSSSQDIVGGFHSVTMPSSPYNWVGVYELHSGTSTGFYQYLPTGSSGTFTIPSSLTATLTSNKLYVLKFFNGAGGYGTTYYGTSNPFYKL